MTKTTPKWGKEIIKIFRKHGLTPDLEEGMDFSFLIMDLSNLIKSELAEFARKVRVEKYKTRKKRGSGYIEFIGSPDSGETLNRWGFNRAIDEQNAKIKKLLGEGR